MRILFNFQQVGICQALWTGDCIQGLSIQYRYSKMFCFNHMVPFDVRCFLGGIQLLAAGILVEYLSKIYMESKQRPHYHIEEII